ncbi:hypothetical protein [Ornithinimicrobium cryptoxanthini]|uniref:ApeA N-terminal domain 1-containing protein n=1 Tax=Ornithinimicrobium cryptoxanthini TaxID=2934161 RepID=UPI002117AF88|nr:hypothetical protein [Ornithinimicrobium cryptoxanthini]
MTNELTLGQTRPGILVDGQEGTPYLACTLTYENGRGPLVEVPYVRGDGQYAAVEPWLQGRETPPTTMAFHDPDGTVTLSGVRWRGDRGADASVGRLDARLAIFGRARELPTEYQVRSLISRIDGLHEFAGFESISTEHERPDGHWRTTVTVHPRDEVLVEHGGMTFRIRATVPMSSSTVEVSALADAVIETTTHGGATVDEHVVAQWPFRALLSLTFGVPLFWREHNLLNEQFPVWMLSGDAHGPAPVPLLLQRTLRDYEKDKVEWRDLALSIFRLGDLGADGLVRWLDFYADPLFSRAVEPAVEVLNGGAGNFLEPRLTLTMFALDALGHYLDETRRPRVPLKEQIARCLDVHGVDWSILGPKAELAQALAHVNNDLKHPDRPKRPDGVEMSLAADLGLVIFRLKIAQLLGLDEALIERFCTTNSFTNAIDAFGRNGVTISEGRFTHTA